MRKIRQYLIGLISQDRRASSPVGTHCSRWLLCKATAVIVGHCLIQSTSISVEIVGVAELLIPILLDGVHLVELVDNIHALNLEHFILLERIILLMLILHHSLLELVQNVMRGRIDGLWVGEIWICDRELEWFVDGRLD